MRKAMVLGVLGLAGTLASPAFADDFSGVRLGLNLSSDQIEQDFFLGPTDLNVVDSVNTGRFGYGLFGGWALNRYFGLEAGLVSGSKFSQDIFPEALSDNEYLVARSDLKGAEVSAVGTVWIGKKFGIFGRVGMFAWKHEETMTGGFYDDPDSKSFATVDDDGFDPVFGIGLQTELDGALIRFEYKMTELGDMTFIERGDPADPDDDFELFNTRDTSVSSLNFSIVWTL